MKGSYGDAWLIESHYVPSGYVIMAATGGLDSDMNPTGFRKHVKVAYQGLRHIPGRGPTPCRTASMRVGSVRAFDIVARQWSCR